jgi:hypothetical protein
VTLGVVGVEHGACELAVEPQAEAFEPPIAPVTIADERRTREKSVS